MAAVLGNWSHQTAACEGQGQTGEQSKSPLLQSPDLKNSISKQYIDSEALLHVTDY